MNKLSSPKRSLDITKAGYNEQIWLLLITVVFSRSSSSEGHQKDCASLCKAKRAHAYINLPLKLFFFVCYSSNAFFLQIASVSALPLAMVLCFSVFSVVKSINVQIQFTKTCGKLKSNENVLSFIIFLKITPRVFIYQ